MKEQINGSSDKNLSILLGKLFPKHINICNFITKTQNYCFKLKKTYKNNKDMNKLLNKFIQTRELKSQGINELYVPELASKLSVVDLLFLIDNDFDFSSLGVGEHKFFITNKDKTQKYSKVITSADNYEGFKDLLEKEKQELGISDNISKKQIVELLNNIFSKYKIEYLYHSLGESYRNVIQIKEFLDIKHEVGLNLGKLGIKGVELYEQIKKVYDKIYQELTKDEFNKKLSKLDSDMELIKFSEMYDDVLEKIEQITLTQDYTKRELIEIIQPLSKQLDYRLDKYMNGTNLNEEDLKKDDPSLLEQSIFDLDPKKMLAIGKPKIGDEFQEVIQMQKTQEMFPTIFRQKSLESIKETQNIMILLDTSDSTKKQEVFKLLDVSCSQVQRVLKGLMGEKANIIIANTNDYIKEIKNNLDSFVYPDGSTNIETAFFSSMKFLAQMKNKSFINSNIAKISSSDNDFLGSIRGRSFIDSFFEDTEPMTEDTIKNLKEKIREKLDAIIPKKGKLRDTHIILLSDGLPNDYEYTKLLAQLIKEYDANYYQIILAYGLREKDEVMQQAIFDSLGGDGIKNMDDYKLQIEELPSEAGGNGMVLWVTDMLAQVMLSMTDLSIGMNYLKGLGYFDDKD